MPRGGAAPYRKGAAHENEVVRHLEALGYFALRSPKSASPIDVLAIGPRYKDNSFWWNDTFFIQAKLAGYMRPAERQAVIDLAAKYGGTPVLAAGRKPIVFTDVRTGEVLHGLARSPVEGDGSGRADRGGDPASG